MKQLFFYFVVLIFIFSCKRKQADEIKIYPINSETVKYFCYKPGSYWIYKDSLTHRIDSFCTIAIDSDSTGLGGKFIQQYFTYNIKFADYITDTSLDTPVGKYNLQLLDGQAFFDFTHNSQDYSNVFFYFPLRVGDNHPGSTDRIWVNYLFPEFTINNIIYDSVFEIDHTNAIGIKNSFFINDMNGIVKMNINNHTDSLSYYYKMGPDTIHHIWELQRCHIVR